jgi:very-short-patch-repair endonuclease
MSWGFCGFEAVKNTTPSQPAANSGATTPPVGHPFKLKGNLGRGDFIPLQFEGVARSDGVVAPESMTRSDGVVAPASAPQSAEAVAPELENFKSIELPYNPALKQRARELRKAGNLSEVLFWNVVKNKQLNGQDFDRQRVIGNYIVDFYCHEHALVVEIDGSSHDDKQAYDQARDEYLKALGLKVLHVQDVDVKQNLAGVVELVRQQLNSRHTATSPRVANSGATTPSLRASDSGTTTPSLRATPSN